MPSIGRNSPCPCGSGKKYKVCCLNSPRGAAQGGTVAKRAPTPERPSPAAIRNALEQATLFYRTGHLADAEGLFRSVLAHEPNHEEAIEGLARLAIEGGRPSAAVTFLEQAVMAHHGFDYGPNVTIPGLQAWVATGRPPEVEPWAWVDLQPSAPDLDPLSQLQHEVYQLRGRVDDLEAQVAALRGEPVS